MESKFVTINQRQINRLGVCDSGVGGLSILHALLPLGIPEYIYVADTANVPYGDKSPEEIQGLAVSLIEFLVEQHVDAIVIACYTMCSVALDLLKERFPNILFIEIIDGTIEQAGSYTKNNKIGIIATQATVNSGLFINKFRGYNSELEIFQKACPQLVPLIEQYPMDHQSIKHTLKMNLTSLILREIDTLVLGCTHYILIQSIIKEVVGYRIALAHVQQNTKRLVESLLHENRNKVSAPNVKIYVTGDKNKFFDPYQLTTGCNIKQATIFLP